MYKYNKILNPGKPIYKDSIQKYIKYLKQNPMNEEEYIYIHNQNIRFNHLYYSDHPESIAAQYYIVSIVFINNTNIDDKNNTKNIMLKIQFVPDWHVVSIPYSVFKSNKVYNPYWLCHFYGHGCIGDIDPIQYENEYLLWQDIMGRCYDPEHPLYYSFGYNGFEVINTFHCFEDFHKINELHKSRGLLPLYDPNDYKLYYRKMPVRYSKDCFTKTEASAIGTYQYSNNELNTHYPMKIKTLQFEDRTNDLLHGAGRPKGSLNKPKKVQMYHLIK